MALARESDELADESGGALDAALADLQRWRRGLRRGEGRGRKGGGREGVRRRRRSSTMWWSSLATTDKGVRRAFLPVHRQSDGHSNCPSCIGTRCAQLCRRPW